MVGVPLAAASPPVRDRASRPCVGLSATAVPADAGDAKTELFADVAAADGTADAQAFEDEARAAGLAVLAGWRERVALRLTADGEGSDGTDAIVDGRDVVTATSELVAGWVAEAASVSPVAASERVRVLAGLADQVATAQAVLVAVVEASAQHAVEGAPSPVAWLTAETGVSAASARRTVAVGRLVDRFAVTRAAVEAGVVSVPKAEVLATAALAKGRDRVYERDEAVLVEAARTLSTTEFAKVVRRWADLADDDLDNGEPAAAFARRGVSLAPLASGNRRIAGELDAAGGAALEAAFVAFDRPDPVDDESCPPRTVAQRRADFLAALAMRALGDANGEAGGPVATIDVIVDIERLAAAVPALVADHGDHDHGDHDHGDGHVGGDGDAGGACHAGGDRSEANAGGDLHDPCTCRRRDEAEGTDDGVPLPEVGPGGGPPGGPPTAHRAGPVPGRPPDGAGPTDRCRAGPPAAGVDRRRGSPPTLGDLLAAVRPDPRGWGDALGVGPIPPQLLAQLTCDCWMGRNVLAGPSTPLDVGRRRRTFTDDQRRAIVARDRHCTHPGCTRGPEWCQIHHLDDWDHDGPTDLANGTLRCTWHHTWYHLQQRQRHLRGTIATATR